MATRLGASDSKLADVAVAQGQLVEAARAYGEGLAIATQRVAGDPSNTGWQRAYLSASDSSRSASLL